MFKIKLYNNIADAGLKHFPTDKYSVNHDITEPNAILLRSENLHEMTIPEELFAVARAGAGTNNIPVERLNEKGIPVFNTPGANANAVKELVIAGLLLASRNICQSWDYTRQLKGDDQEVSVAVEKGKKQFVGFELPGRTIAVIGLGAIGVKVANAAVSLGMRVIGFDPGITIRRAWELSSDVEKAEQIEHALQAADFVSVHVPYNPNTENLFNQNTINAMKAGAVLINFARAGIVNQDAVLAALETNKLHYYICDFPSNRIKDHKNVITLPHLGASTKEAEENCAVMAAQQLRAYLEDGTIHNSINFPETKMPRNGGTRIAITNANVPNMLGQISTTLAEANLNIVDMINKSREDLAYTLLDVEGEVPEETINQLRSIEGVLCLRVLPKK